jgi:peptidoglycan/LPS O-acetylase OafA/YrhL
MRLTAQLSYALYLYHPLAGRIVKLLGMRHLGYPAVILTFIMAPASYYLVERPFMRMRDRRRPAKLPYPPEQSLPLGGADAPRQLSRSPLPQPLNPSGEFNKSSSVDGRQQDRPNARPFIFRIGT